eukprot:4478008-Prorocentrum_lima.AAC.1
MSMTGRRATTRLAMNAGRANKTTSCGPKPDAGTARSRSSSASSSSSASYGLWTLDSATRLL